MLSHPQQSLLLLTPHVPVPVFSSRSAQARILFSLPPDSIFEFSDFDGDWARLSPSEYPRAEYHSTTARAAALQADGAWCAASISDSASPMPVIQRLLPPEHQAEADAVAAHRLLSSQAALISLMNAQAADVVPTLCSLLSTPSAAAQAYACCACRTPLCLPAITRSVDSSLNMLKCLQRLLPDCALRRAACSALWAVGGEALSEHPSDQRLLQAWHDWSSAVLFMGDEGGLDDALAGLALSITSAHRQQLFVGLGVLPLLLQLLRAFAPYAHQDRSMYGAGSGDDVVTSFARKESILVVICRLSENLTAAGKDHAAAQKAVASSDLLPLIVSFCEPNAVPASELELPTRILWLLSIQCGSELDAKGTTPVMCRLLLTPHEGALINALLCLGNLARFNQGSMARLVEDAGVVLVMLSLLRTCSVEVQEWVCWSMQHLLSHLGPSIVLKLRGPDVLSALLPLTRSHATNVRRQAIATLCTVILSGFSDADGALAWFYALRDAGDEEALLIMMEVITNEPTQHKRLRILELFGVRGVIQLLKHPSEMVQASACALVCVLVSESHVSAISSSSASLHDTPDPNETGQALLAGGVVAALSELVQAQRDEVLLAAIDAITCLSTGSRLYQESFVDVKFAKLICLLLKSSTVEIQEKSARATWVLCIACKRNQDVFGYQNVAVPIVRLLASDTVSVQEQALVATCVLCNGHEDNRDTFYDAGCARVIHKLMLSSVLSVQENATAALWELCKGCTLPSSRIVFL